MKKSTWKWTVLVACTGTLLQFGTCATDLLYYIVQAAATQIAGGLLTGLADAATTGA